MGYDVTYHPITENEMNEWFFQPLLNDSAIEPLAEKYGFRTENYRHLMQSFRKKIAENEGVPFETYYGFQLAIIQGLFRRYDYFRGSAFSFLLDRKPVYRCYTKSFRDIVPPQLSRLSFRNGICHNYTGGVFIPPEQIIALLEGIEHNTEVRSWFRSHSIREDLLYTFEDEEYGVNQFVHLLKLAKADGLGILEATDVICIDGSCCSDERNCKDCNEFSADETKANTQLLELSISPFLKDVDSPIFKYL
jgi:hypothetical protein